MVGLSPDTIAYLRAGGRETSYPDAAVILRRGQSGEAFYVVTAGTVEVILVADGGQRLPLARLPQGASFGEMSLLTGEPISADVVARGPVTVLAYPADRFQAALAESAALRGHVLARLCDDLRRTSANSWKFFQRGEVLKTLMQAQGRTGPVVASSAAMARVEKRIAELARAAGPLLITGESGTGKCFAARKIHEAAGEGESPLVMVDAQRLGPEGAGTLLFGSAGDRPFWTQGGPSGDLHLFGAMHLADGGALVLAHVDALDGPSQETLARYLEAISSNGDGVFPRVRLMATTCRDLRALAGEGRFHAALAERLSAETLTLPPMRERKRDILPLANLFLDEWARRLYELPQHLSQSAEHALVAAPYRHRNVAELREAAEFAAVVAEGCQIGAEHIFTGPKDAGAAVEYDLMQHDLVRLLLAPGVLKLLRAATLGFFVIITAICLLCGGTEAGAIANDLTWWLWWPALILIFVFIGRAWCTVCPISLVGRLARRAGGLDRKPPGWLKNRAVGISVVLFLAIIWAEHVFGMARHPFATGILLVTLMGAAAAFSLIFEREVWCRYLCPLGSLGASYSVGAMVHLHAQPGVCGTQCTTHECFRGGPTTAPCPVFHHPMYARDSHACKLCLNCVRGCQHGSARLYLRPPLQGVWRAGDLSAALTPFALPVFFLVLVMLASHEAKWAGATAAYSAAALAAVGAGVALRGALERLILPGDSHDAALASPVAFALLVLAAGPLAAFHLANIPWLEELRVHATAGSFWFQEFGPAEVDLLTVLQLAVIVLAGLLAWVALGRTRSRLADEGVAPAPWRWAVLLALCGSYFLAAVGLALLRGIHS